MCAIQRKCYRYRNLWHNNPWFHLVCNPLCPGNGFAACVWCHLCGLLQSNGRSPNDPHANQIFRIGYATRDRLAWHRRWQIEFHRSHFRVSITRAISEWCKQPFTATITIKPPFVYFCNFPPNAVISKKSKRAFLSTSAISYLSSLRL